MTSTAGPTEVEMLRRQREIALELDVTDVFAPEREIERRVAFLADRLAGAGARSLVLGISGGVDSTTTGRLCQLAVERVRADAGDATFFAVRLPYGEQHDEDDARLALDSIAADQVLTVNIRDAADAMIETLTGAGMRWRDAAHRDFVHGNVKARQRMIAQYAIAGANDGLVVGTDHAAEAVTGFFTKFGDGAADLTPLTGLTKRRVRAVATALGVPRKLVEKVPTADLESLDPGKADEHALGVTYDTIDDFLEGQPVPADAFATIEARYRATEHKRRLPFAP